MSDIEERPSKIRKIEATDDTSASTITNSPGSSVETIPIEFDKSKIRDNDPTNADSDKPKAPSEAEPTLSKNQLKRLRKKQQWEAQKASRTELRRTKRRERAARKAVLKADGLLPPPPPPSCRRPLQVPISFILDCDFETYMTEKELISLTAQVTRCYSDNRTAVYRGHMAISSWGGKMRERFETVLSANYKGWKGVKFLEENWVDAGETMHGLMKEEGGGKLLGALATKNGLEDQSISKIRNDKKNSSLNAITAGEALQEPKPIDPDSAEDLQSPKPKTEEMVEQKSPENPISLAYPPETAPDSEPKIEETVEQRSPGKSESLAYPPENALDPEPMEIVSTEPNLQSPNLVYLSSDSPNTLTTLSPYTSYIIGGIVDKNRHKGLCYKRACDAGIPTAKLPIGEYMDMQARKVLTVNHVMEIMIRWLETGDWAEAFLKVIPKRKEAKLKGKEKHGQGKCEEEGSESESESEDEDEDEEEGGVSLDIKHEDENGKDDGAEKVALTDTILLSSKS